VVNGNNSCGCGKCSEATWRNIAPRRAKGAQCKYCVLWGGGGEGKTKSIISLGGLHLFLFLWEWWKIIPPRKERGGMCKIFFWGGGGGEEYNVKYHLCTGPSSIFIFVAVKRGLVNGVFKLKCSSMGKTSF